MYVSDWFYPHFGLSEVEHWLNQLCEELSERIQSDFDQNKRVAHTLTLHATAYKANDEDCWKKFPSKSCPFRYGTAKIKEDAKKLFDCALRDFLGSQSSRWRVTSLSVAASKILDIPPGTCSILKFFQGKSLSSTSCNGYDEFAQDDLPSSPSGSKSYVTENEHEQQRKIDCEASGKVDATYYQDITVQTSGKLDKISKDKGAGSILNFFQGSSSRSTNQSSNGSNKNLCFSPGSEGCSVFNQTEHKGGDILAEGSNEDNIQNVQRGDTWALNVEDIDPSVIDELPLEIQREVRGWLRPPKRPKTIKRGSTIAHYFSPAKSS